MFERLEGRGRIGGIFLRNGLVQQQCFVYGGWIVLVSSESLCWFGSQKSGALGFGFGLRLADRAARAKVTAR